MESNNANGTALPMMGQFFQPQQYVFPPHGDGGATEESVSLELSSMKATEDTIHQRNGSAGAAGGNHSNTAQWLPCQAQNYLPYGYPYFNPQLNSLQMPAPLLFPPHFLPPAPPQHAPPPPQHAPPPPAPTPPSEHGHGFDNSSNHFEQEYVTVKTEQGEPAGTGEEELPQPGPSGECYQEKLDNPLQFYVDNSTVQTSENQELSNAATLESFGITAEEYGSRCELLEEFKRIISDTDVDNETLTGLINYFSRDAVVANSEIKSNTPLDQIMQMYEYEAE